MVNFDDRLFVLVGLMVGTKSFIVNCEILVEHCNYEKVIQTCLPIFDKSSLWTCAFLFFFFFDTPCSARIFMLLLAKLSLLLKETDFPQVKTDTYDCTNQCYS